MTPLVVENEPPVTFLRRKMTGGRFPMGVVICRYTCNRPYLDVAKYIFDIYFLLTMLFVYWFL